MVSEILGFLKELQRNNNREWFQAHKGRFDTLRKGFLDIVQQLITRITLFDPEVAGVEAKDCVFRIYRDVRFSPNKLPYKNHFGAYITSGGKNSPRSGYYFHLEPGNSLVSGGLWRPEPKLLKKVRQDIYDQMDEFIEILEEPSFKNIYPGLDGDSLKRNPAGFPSSFEHDDIIRHKDFCVNYILPEHIFNTPDWIDRVSHCFELQLPFNQFLNYTVDEYLGRI